ncbi:uncharacterized protein CcaverHIS019_0505090 [Cutaneotrichosporon cavernicola]|uniref:Non-structural maintenance of chromosomes element 4 n=1 Tax=Cutaneotrichosporon cavernicola TaxID=279322 RepID=A0AA48QX03_9TREE|nr:uncharacterized protein CcaverHIS019_0505090 [Cutaneotrichosporon cavernicola]BEI92881.1 hypothetical protein CcaverHIS019_0505090 [Cutaneotrichosporon cavernicola]BEJ00657.1 hypothetical protein CcaverHIS631_0505140 [Cutaneotrichosporon cavernicola]BEJ08423.1 hypothetical protein CcaverHIS641_0505080 [Cutaneotrichosporon cavernicola]
MDDLRRSEVFGSLDPREKAELSRRFNDLQGRTDDMRANLENVAPEAIIDILRGADKLYRVRDTDIANQDARVVREAAEMSAALLRKQKLGGASFDVDEFLARVKGVLDIEEEEVGSDDEEAPRRQNLGSWEALGWMAARMSRRAPGVEFLYGPLGVEHTRKEKRQRVRQAVAPEQRPVEIETQSKAKAADPTLANVRSVDKALRRLDTSGQGLNFFAFVCNPESFSQTVENIFYVSFLVREGRAGIDVAEDGLVKIYARSPRSEDDEGEGGVRHQAVMEMDMATWREAVEIFDLRESLIPTRAPVSTQGPSATGWYGA